MRKQNSLIFSNLTVGTQLMIGVTWIKIDFQPEYACFELLKIKWVLKNFFWLFFFFFLLLEERPFWNFVQKCQNVQVTIWASDNIWLNLKGFLT